MGRKKKKSTSSESGERTGWFGQQISRRTVGRGLAWSAVLGMAGVTIYKVSDDDSSEISYDSLKLQREEGWNVGSVARPLIFQAGLSAVDSRKEKWSAVDPNFLIPIYQPRSPEWQPFFVPTLLQSLAQPSLNSQIRPVITETMRDAYDRTEGLHNLISQAPEANKTLLIADLPGPESVALGAAMSDVAHLIPLFDNWPHPLGVVRSHETLGAMVYYAREIDENRRKMPETAPAMLLLDSNRLAPYTDQDSQFDNRYLAKMPPVSQLKQRGIEQVIYIVRDQRQTRELDDINDDLVDWQKNGINVRMLRLSDFKPASAGQTLAGGTGDWSDSSGQTSGSHRHYYYGGSPVSHWWFYSHYSYRQPGRLTIPSGGRNIPIPRPTTRSAGFQPPSYRPVSRPTIFTASRIGGAGGVGKTRPSGFGRTSVRVSQAGRVIGTRPGRSGSYGRSGGSWFGG